MKKCEIGSAVSVEPIGHPFTRFDGAKGASSIWQNFYAYGIDCWTSPIEGEGTMELRIVNYYCHECASMCYVAEDWWQGP